MPGAPLAIKLRCTSWEQLAALVERDLSRGAMFMRAQAPPPKGTPMRIELTLPSGSVVPLEGAVGDRVTGPRGSGIDVTLVPLPHSVMWVIESALAAAGKKPQQPAPEPVAEQEPEAAVAEEELVAALEAELEAMRNLNAHQVLGVDYEADEDVVRHAFGQLSKKYHPDRFARYESERARMMAGEIFILIREAYRRLSDPVLRERGRAATDRGLARPASPRASTVAGVAPPPPPAPDLAATSTAPTDDADRHLEAGRWSEARVAYEAVLRGKPGDRFARVGREIAHGLELLAAGDRDGACARFDAALEADPLNERAARELAAARRASTESRKGALGKLLGRKPS